MVTKVTTPLWDLARRLSGGVLVCALVSGGCQGGHPKPTTVPVLAVPMESVGAWVMPPSGWRMDPLKSSGSHTHQVWVSPSGRTAYGVIHFTLPLAVSANFVMPFYMRAWRKDQGEATLISKVEDPSLPGLRYVAEGGLYKVWGNLIVAGYEGWSVYAGVHRGEPVDEGELAQAAAAREGTRVGLGDKK